MSIVIQRKFPNGIFHVGVDGKTLIYNIFKVMKYHADDYFILSINLIDFLVQVVFELDDKVELDVELSEKSWMQIDELEELHFEYAR